ncbi:MAG: hypothetical protein PHD01_18775, partial [Geobacteraceae bacterium]|nr:hypothetical protein [Geobacteraceae bacterium]
MKITEIDNTQPYAGSKREFLGWFNEAIWGHRLERQPGSALLLEFLGMAEAMHRDGKLFALTEPGEDVRYSANTSIHLRSILFNNPLMEEIRARCQGSDEDAWEMWLSEIKNQAAVGDKFTADFSYLRQRFHSFSDLVSRINLLRRITMDPVSGRTWTRQLLFPIGPAALYEPSNERLERDRLLFTRTGELAYLMLSRASESLRESLAEKLSPLFYSVTTRNKLLTSLLPTAEPESASMKGGTYLPYKTHPAYDRLAEDVHNLLSLGLPDQDVLEYLMHIIAFNIYIYAIETSNHWLEMEHIPVCVCEIPGPRMDVVRKASIATRDENEGRGMLAVRRFVELAIGCNSEINEKLNSPNIPEEEKAELLAEHLAQICSVDEDDLKATSVEEVRRKVISLAERGFRDGTAVALQGLGRVAGLLDKRGTNKVRYAPTDRLLRTL